MYAGAGAASTLADSDFFARGEDHFAWGATAVGCCCSSPLAVFRMCFFPLFLVCQLASPCRWLCHCRNSSLEMIFGLLRCVAYAAAACLNGQQIQATVDLAAPFAPLIARLLGPGVATCPVSSAVVPTTTNTGRGEWLFPTGAGRESDLLPPLPTARGKLILYLHGGAFVLCGAQTHRLISFEIVRRTGAVMLMPAYTRPPHCRYPTTLDECARIYCEWLAATALRMSS